MESRLMRSLRQRAAEAADPVEAACVEAQIAIGHSRQGEHESAEAIVRSIRERFGGARPNAEALAWASLAEAVDRFYRHPGPEAADRLLRAQALGRMMPPTELQPLSAAWLAHVEFNANRMERMVDHAAEALRLARPEHHAALARVSLVVADAYHFAGRFDLAKGWYAAVRDHALALGDDAMMSALLHNRATLRANQVRVASAFKLHDEAEIRAAALEAESTLNYDAAIGIRSLASFLPLIQAQLRSAEGKYEEAIRLFAITLEEERRDNLVRRKASFYGDRAWCRLQVGQLEAARSDVEAAKACLDLTTDVDDLAVTHARIAATLEGVSCADAAEGHKAESLRLLNEYRRAQDELLQLLAEKLPSAATVTR